MRCKPNCDHLYVLVCADPNPSDYRLVSYFCAIHTADCQRVRSRDSLVRYIIERLLVDNFLKYRYIGDSMTLL